MLPKEQDGEQKAMQRDLANLIQNYLDNDIKPIFHERAQKIIQGQDPSFYQVGKSHWAGTQELNGWHVLDFSSTLKTPSYGFVNLVDGNVLFSGVICTADFKEALMTPMLSIENYNLLCWVPLKEGFSIPSDGLFCCD